MIVFDHITSLIRDRRANQLVIFDDKYILLHN